MVRVPDVEIPVAADVDVVVAGGGPAGFAAGIAAAREGADTLIVEATGCLGGQATSGLVGPFMPTFGMEGIYTELCERMDKLGGLKDERRFDAEVMKYVTMLMVEESGARQLLFTVTEDPLVEGNRVTGVVIVNKAGRAAVRSKILIDCTGDGDVAFQAGAESEKGREDGKLQASSLWLQIAGVDEAALEAGRGEYTEHAAEYARAERKAGRLNLPEHVCPGMIWKGSTLAPGEYGVNIDTTVDTDGTDPWSLTAGMNESRKRVFEVMEFFRKYLPGGKECHLQKTGSIFGIRETRRFRGVDTVTGQDVVDGRKRDDGICRASFFLDLHDGEIQWHKQMEEKYGRTTPPEGDWYEIPYGCLVPAKKDGLLLAGRNISSDRDANGSLRVMPTCMALGQAAGTAAAICAEEGSQPRELPASRVQAALRERYGVTMAR